MLFIYWQIEKLKAESGNPSIQQKIRLKDKAADAKKIQDLERQVCVQGKFSWAYFMYSAFWFSLLFQEFPRDGVDLEIFVLKYLH